MKLLNVKSDEFLTSKDFLSCISFIKNTIISRKEKLSNKYKDFEIKSRCDLAKTNWSYYPRNQNIPFFDSVCESLLYKDGHGYLEVEEFAYQLDCFSKAIIHRKLWADHFQNSNDKFFEMVYQDWNDNQHEGEFDRLKETALILLDRSPNLTEYHVNFVYNENYNFITVNDVIELFDQLVEHNIFLDRQGDLYKVFENCFDIGDLDMKTKLNSGLISKMDSIYIRSKFKVDFIPKLRKIKSKFNFIPIHSDLSKFEPLVALVKLDNKIWFLPQFLVFYS